MTDVDANLNPNVNGDLGKRAHAVSASMPWQASPSGAVWRKRLHLVGGAETGQDQHSISNTKTGKQQSDQHSTWIITACAIGL